jgi:hypothetical protein
VVMIEVITNDEIIVEEINFIFTKRRIYTRERNTWYNKELDQRINNEDWGKYSGRELVHGRNNDIKRVR